MVTVEMARCIAKITGDGCLYYRYIRYNNTCKELLEEFVSDIKKEFKHCKFTYGITNTKTPFVQIHGKSIIGSFLNYLTSYKSVDVFVPSQILSASKKVKRVYIRALFDDEGSVGIRVFAKTGEWKRNIKIDSKSYDLLKGLNILLSEFGITTNQIKMCRKGDKSWYYTGVSGYQNFVKFSNEIGFSSLIKRKKLALLIKTYGATYKRKFSEFLKLVEELKFIRMEGELTLKANK
jgi:replicative DNA helicase Mcm